MPTIDMDAILAQREEATGSPDSFAFTFRDREWTCTDPITAADDWKEALDELQGDVEVAEHYLGDDQYAAFVEAGGRAGYVLLAIAQYMKQVRAENDEGRPTRRSTSSGKRRKQ